jgi:hypothetical protein
MPVKTSEKKVSMSRLEARIPTPLYEQMERAAKLRGLSLTAYTAGEDARRVDSGNGNPPNDPRRSDRSRASAHRSARTERKTKRRQTPS